MSSQPNTMNDSIEVKLELGHKAILKKGYNPEGYTHDWKLFVRGPEGCNIQHFIEKVVFHLHSTFPKPKRVLKDPPYEVQECGYAGFHVPIDIYFKNKNEPKKLQFLYDLFLRVDEQVNHIRCEKLTFQNPTDDFRKRLLLSGGSSKSAAEVSKDGGGGTGGSNRKSPVQQPGPQTTPKSVPPPANTPESRAFAELFGPPDLAKKAKKKSSEKPEKSSTPKPTKPEASSIPSKPDTSPAPGSSHHSNKIIDLTSDKSNHSSSGSSSKHKQSEKPRSSSSHKDGKHRHGSEGRGSGGKVSSERHPPDSQDRLHPSSAEKKAGHERRSGSHEKSQGSSSQDAPDKRSKSQDKSFSSHDRRSGSHEKHSQSSQERKPSSHEKQSSSKSNEGRSSTSQEKSSVSMDKSSSSQDKQSHDRRSGSHEKHVSSKTSSHSSHGIPEKTEKSHHSSSNSSSLNKSSSKRPAEEIMLVQEDSSVSKKKKKKDKDRERDSVKEIKAVKEGSDRERKEKKDKTERVDEKKTKDRPRPEKPDEYKGEKERDKVDRQRDKEDRQKERVEEKSSQKHQGQQRSVDKKPERDRKEEKRDRSERRDDRPHKPTKETEYKRQGSSSNKEGQGSSGKDKKKSRSKEEGRDPIVIVDSNRETVREEMVPKKVEREPKFEKDEKKSGKKRKKGTEDLDSCLSDSDSISLVDDDMVGKKKKKKHSHRSKSYSSSSQVKKKISEIYTDSDEEGEIKDNSMTGVRVKSEGLDSPAKVKLKREERGHNVKVKAKKQSGEEVVGRDSKSRDMMRDLFSLSDEDSQQDEDQPEEEDMAVDEDRSHEEPGEYISPTHSDSEEDDTRLSDLESEEEIPRKPVAKPGKHSKKSEKTPKAASKPAAAATDTKSLFRDDIFSTGELSDDDPFGDNLSRTNEDPHKEPSNSFKENTKPLDKLLSEIDTGSSLDDEDILSPIEHAPLFSPRKPPPSQAPAAVSSKSPRTKHYDSSTPYTKSAGSGSVRDSQPKSEKPDPVTSHRSPPEKHRSPAARGGKGPSNHNSQLVKNNYNSVKEEPRVQDHMGGDSSTVNSVPGGNNVRREKGSIIANKSPKVPSDVGKLVSDAEDELNGESESEMEDGEDRDGNESASSGSSSSSGESGENSESEEEGEDSDNEPVDRMEELRKEEQQKEVKREPEKDKYEMYKERDARKGLSQAAAAGTVRGSAQTKDKDRLKLESHGGFMSEYGAGGDNNEMRRSDTGIFDEFLLNDDSEMSQQQQQLEGGGEKTSGHGNKRKNSPSNNGPSNVARVQPLVRDKGDLKERMSKDNKKGGFSGVPPSMAGGGESKGSGAGKEGSGTSGEDMYSRKAPNGEYLGSLLDLQKKLYSIMSNRELLNNIVKIIMKDDTFYSITDTTFDFDLCRLDKNTLNKIEGFLQTTN